MKFTRWFGPDEKPGKKMVGVYPVKFAFSGNLKRYARWNGEQWGRMSLTVAGARTRPAFNSADQNKHWRGLVTKDGK